MATQVQWRGGSTAEHATFTGAAREVTVDTQKKTLVVHDGSTAGGVPLMKEQPPVGSAGAPTYTFSGDTNTGIYSPGADQLALSTNGTGRLFVDANGVVDIYNSTPKLGFSSVGSFYNWIECGGVAGNNYMRFATANSERLRITSAGLVGVGTSSPSNTAGFGQQVEIAGTLPCLTLNQNNAGFTTRKYSLAVNGSGDFGIWDNTASTYRMYIDSSGRLGVGTTSPGSPLTIESSAGNQVKITYPSIASYFLNATSGGDFAINKDGTERLRIDSSGRLLVGTSSQSNTGGTLCVNNGIGIVNNTTSRFATVEHGNGASGTFTTITISATVQNSSGSVIFETLMTGFSGVYLDNVSAKYSSQTTVTMRNNASVGTSAALTVNGAGTTYTLTITTSVTHPVVKVKVTAGGLVGDITLPTITFA